MVNPVVYNVKLDSDVFRPSLIWQTTHVAPAKLPRMYASRMERHVIYLWTYTMLTKRFAAIQVKNVWQVKWKVPLPAKISLQHALLVDRLVIHRLRDKTLTNRFVAIQVRNAWELRHRLMQYTLAERTQISISV
jgi:hypothetical protein